MPSSTATESIPTTEVNARSKSAPFTTLYAATIFLSAFLLFQVQLIIGKHVLPWFGGSPSVWNTCLLLFQILLLLGYLYAHAVSTRLTMRSQTRLHFAFLLASLAVLAVMAHRWPSPITPSAVWKPVPGGSPEWRVIFLLFVNVGVPFLILSPPGPFPHFLLPPPQPPHPSPPYPLSN